MTAKQMLDDIDKVVEWYVGPYGSGENRSAEEAVARIRGIVAGHYPHRILAQNGRCGFCNRSVREVADYRGGRYRHADTFSAVGWTRATPPSKKVGP